MAKARRQSYSKVGRSTTIPAGPVKQKARPSLSLRKMYTPGIKLGLGTS